MSHETLSSKCSIFRNEEIGIPQPIGIRVALSEKI